MTRTVAATTVTSAAVITTITPSVVVTSGVTQESDIVDQPDENSAGI